MFFPQMVSQAKMLVNLQVLRFPAALPAGGSAELDPGRLALPVAWTLLYEVYFYMAFATFIATRRKKSIRAVIIALAIVVLLNMCANVIGMYMPERISGTPVAITLYLSPFCAEFLAGCLIA